MVMSRGNFCGSRNNSVEIISPSRPISSHQDQHQRHLTGEWDSHKPACCKKNTGTMGRLPGCCKSTGTMGRLPPCCKSTGTMGRLPGCCKSTKKFKCCKGSGTVGKSLKTLRTSTKCL